jgi:acyl-CoA thioesterase
MSGAPDTPAQAVAEAAAQAMWAADQASRALGMALIAVSPGHATVRMTVRADMCNGYQLCHGGMIFTLADSAFAVACNSHNRVTVANNCNVAFVSSAKAGDVLTAEAVERHRGGRSGTYDVTVTDQTGRLIAVFRGHSTQVQGTVVPPGPPADGPPKG